MAGNPEKNRYTVCDTWVMSKVTSNTNTLFPHASANVVPQRNIKMAYYFCFRSLSFHFPFQNQNNADC